MGMSEKTALRRRVTPSVPFTFEVEDANGDKFEQSFRLAYDLNAIALFEEVTGHNLLREIDVLFKNPSVTTITAMVWAGLQPYHADDFGSVEGLQIVRANLTLPQLTGALSKCIEAFLSQLPKEKADAIRKASEGTSEESPLANSPAQ